MKAPKYMNSKFDSSCCDCGRRINAGERIRYLGRSKAECSECMLPESAQALISQSVGSDIPADRPAADKWADALAWDESEPVPGQSIGSHNSTSVAEAIQLRDTVKAGVISNGEKKFEVVTPIKPDDDQLADIGRGIIDQADDRFSTFTQSERAEGMACELLVVLVNAISVAGVTGRLTLADFCRDNARNTESGSRASLWAGIARTIQQSA